MDENRDQKNDPFNFNRPQEPLPPEDEPAPTTGGAREYTAPSSHPPEPVGPAREYAPTPLSPAPAQTPSNASRIWLIVVIVLVVLCCCCLALAAFMWFWGGDFILCQMGVLDPSLCR